MDEAFSPKAQKYTIAQALFLQLGFIGVIWLGGVFGLMMPYVNSNISPIWPPSGIGLFILLCFGSRFLPSIALGSLAINCIPFMGHEALPIPAALGIMVGSTLSLWVAYSSFHWLRISLELERPQDVLGFLLAVVIGATLIAALMGVLSLVFFNVIPATDLGMGILTWWVGDAIGILLLTPFFLIWRQLPKWNLQKWGELGVAFLASFIVAEIVFDFTGQYASNQYPTTFLVFPILFWVAIRFHHHGVTLLSIVICSIGIYTTINGLGNFKLASPNGSILLLQSYIFVICASGLILASIEQGRQKARQFQIETLALHQKTSQMVPGMIYQYQLFPDGRSCFPYSSVGIQEIYGITPESVKEDASKVIQNIHSEDLNRVMDSIQESAKTLTLWKCDYRYQHPRKGLRWLSGDSTPERLSDGSVLWHGFITDTTARIEKESELKTTAHRLLLATQSAQIGVWECDLLKNQLWWDDRMYELYQIVPSDNHNYEIWAGALHPEDRAKAEGDIKTALKEKTIFDSEFRIILPDGHVRYIKAFGSVQQDLFGNATGIMGVNWDQTKIKEAEQQLLIGKKQAEEADRSKSEFLAMMSHEIRTPMNGVIGFARLLQTTSLTEEQLEFAQMIESSGQSLMNLLNDILDLSKIEAKKVELEKHPAEIRHLIQDVCTLFKGKAEEKNLSIEFSIDPEVPSMLLMDPTRFKQILQNLIINAIKFSNQGKIEIKLSRSFGPSDSNSLIGLRLSVQDQGIGILPEVLPRLFNPFVQGDSSTTRRFGGTGLGLVIVKRLCELMGGGVEVQSELNHGSTFVCTLKVEVPSVEEDFIFSK